MTMIRGKRAHPGVYPSIMQEQAGWMATDPIIIMSICLCEEYGTVRHEATNQGSLQSATGLLPRLMWERSSQSRQSLPQMVEDAD